MPIHLHLFSRPCKMLGLLLSLRFGRFRKGNMRSHLVTVRNFACTLALVSLFDIALVHSAIAQISQGTRDDANRLIGSIYAGPSMTTLRELSDGFGGRLSGSPAYNRSAEWAA